MLSNDTREKLVSSFFHFGKSADVAEAFKVSRSYVYKLATQMKETGSVDSLVHQRGRKRILTQANLDDIRNLLEKHPDLTIYEIKDQLSLPCSRETVRRAVKELKITFKKKSLRASERDRGDVSCKRLAWPMVELCWCLSHLVFLDECGVNINLTRRYAWGPRGSRVFSSVPLNTPTNTTILSSIRVNGEMTYVVYKGGTNEERFLQYLQILLPTLHPDDILIMDNMSSHRTKKVQELLKEAGVKYLYLPPYSPDLNPIEKAWAKAKGVLRKLGARTPEALLEAIDKAMKTITPDDCVGYFSSCGYSEI